MTEGAEIWQKDQKYPGTITLVPSIEELYDRFAHLVYRRCLMLLGNPAEAEDALQEVFVRAMRSLDSFRGDCSPMTWLYRISTNHCLNVIRGSKRRREGKERRVAQLQSEPPRSGPAAEEIAIVRQVLPAFERKVQEMAVLYYVDGMNLDEVARETGLSVPTVRKRLRKFVEKARKLLE